MIYAETPLDAAVNEIERLRKEVNEYDKLLLAVARKLGRSKMIWIELHGYDTDNSYWVNIDAAFVMSVNSGRGTTLHFARDYTLVVKETPQDIIRLAIEAEPIPVD